MTVIPPRIDPHEVNRVVDIPEYTFEHHALMRNRDPLIAPVIAPGVNALIAFLEDGPAIWKECMYILLSKSSMARKTARNILARAVNVGFITQSQNADAELRVIGLTKWPMPDKHAWVHYSKLFRSGDNGRGKFKPVPISGLAKGMNAVAPSAGTEDRIKDAIKDGALKILTVEGVKCVEVVPKK